MDALWYLLKDDQLRDNPLNVDCRLGPIARSPIASFYTTDNADIHAVIADLRLVAEHAS
jgi:alpha-glucosidase